MGSKLKGEIFLTNPLGLVARFQLRNQFSLDHFHRQNYNTHLSVGTKKTGIAKYVNRGHKKGGFPGVEFICPFTKEICPFFHPCAVFFH